MQRARILLAAAALTSAALATQAPAASAATVNCSVKNYTFLWWPRGHKAIPSVKFPAYPVPHMEFYKPGSSYPNSNSLGYADAAGNGGFSSSKCHSAASGIVGSRVPNAESATSATALKCAFSRVPRFNLTRGSGGSRFRAYVGKTLVVSAKLSATGSSIAFTTTFCRKARPPR